MLMLRNISKILDRWIGSISQFCEPNSNEPVTKHLVCVTFRKQRFELEKILEYRNIHEFKLYEYATFHAVPSIPEYLWELAVQTKG